MGPVLFRLPLRQSIVVLFEAAENDPGRDCGSADVAVARSCEADDVDIVHAELTFRRNVISSLNVEEPSFSANVRVASGRVNLHACWEISEPGFSGRGCNLIGFL